MAHATPFPASAGVSWPGSTHLYKSSMNFTSNSSTDNVSVDMFPGGICDVYSAPHRDYTQIPAVTLIIVVLYILVIFLAVSGNTLVIWTVWRNTHMHTVTNYYIVNLAISDLLVTAIVMPLKLLEYTAPCEWHVFGSDALCSVLYYLLPIFVFASVLTLVAISLERYYAIVHPLSAMKINSKSRTRKIIAATWLIPIILASPYIYCRSYAFVISSDLGQISRQICNDRFDEIDVAMYGKTALGSGGFRRGFFIFLFLAVYLIPMVLIVVTCIKIAICLLQPISIKRSPPLGRKDAGKRHEENKRKVARMVVVVAIAFIMAWSPQYLVSIISQLQSLNGDTFLRQGNFLFTMLMTHLCGFINSCINPIIYTVMSRRFRQSFKQILGKCLCCCISRRIFRYRDSLTRGLSAAFTSTVRQSFTDVRDGHDYTLSEPASSGGSSSGGNSHQGRTTSSFRSKAESGPFVEKSGRKSSGFCRRLTNQTTKENKGGYQIMLKCMKKESTQKESAQKEHTDNDNTETTENTIISPKAGDIKECTDNMGLSESVKTCQEYLTTDSPEVPFDRCSDMLDSDNECGTSIDQINAIKEEYELSLKSSAVIVDGTDFSLVSNGHVINGHCVRL